METEHQSSGEAIAKISHCDKGLVGCLFRLEGEADMVLSYSTSPAYHLIAEGKDNYAAAPFSEWSLHALGKNFESSKTRFTILFRDFDR